MGNQLQGWGGALCEDEVIATFGSVLADDRQGLIQLLVPEDFRLCALSTAPEFPGQNSRPPRG